MSDADLAIEHLRSMQPGAQSAPGSTTAQSAPGAPGGERTTSSDLSVDEAILLDEAGYEPCGMVTGSAVYRPSIFGRYASPGANVELAALSGALHEARRLAMSRLVGEAEALGAAGVAGVRLDVRGAEGAGRDMEFFALGTAVSRRGSDSRGSDSRDSDSRDSDSRDSDSRGSDSRGAARVFTSNLSGQELYLLERSGHTPVGLVMGVCVYHVARRSLGSWWSGMGRNIELANPTTALYDSREIAMSRLQQEALQAGAAGVVGVRIDQRSHVWGSRVVEFVAIGTAVTGTAAPGMALTGMAASGTARSYLPLGVRFAVPLDDPVRATDPRRLLGG